VVADDRQRAPLPSHFHEVRDAVFAGVFLLRGMASATGRLDALSSRVVCDHVEALATRTDGDGVWVLAWNMTLDQTRAAGSALLARDVTMRVRGLRACSTCTLEHHRVDADHSDIAGVWGRISQQGQDWPDEQQWEALRGADRLDTVEPPRTVTAERPRRGPGAVRAADAGHVAARVSPRAPTELRRCVRRGMRAGVPSADAGVHARGVRSRAWWVRGGLCRS
jgi:hypothetical protein